MLQLHLHSLLNIWFHYILHEDNFTRRRETFKFCDLVWLLLETWRKFTRVVATMAVVWATRCQCRCTEVWWRHVTESFPQYWLFVWGIHPWSVDSSHKGPVMRSFDVSFDVSLNKLLNKQSRCRCIEIYRCSFSVTVMRSWGNISPESTITVS